MQKKISFIIFTLCLIVSVALPVIAGWQVDRQLRFQLAYTPDGKVVPGNSIKVPSMKLSKEYLPDIDNIVLSDIKGLGFTLPDRKKPEKFKLYLKLFNFPENLKAADICPEVLRVYHIADMPESGRKLVNYTSGNGNAAVKFGYIDASDRLFTENSPYPSFLSGNDAAFSGAFMKNTPFYSLYLNPDKNLKSSDKDELARSSAQGVLDFHRELLDHYNKTLTPVKGKESEKYYYFRDDKKRVTIKILKEPMVFKNWRDLPMPTDPARHFLSGLLLIYLSDDGDSKLAKETVFEVGSIVRLP